MTPTRHVLALAALAAAVAPLGAQTRLLRSPTVSERHVAFAYANNIWIVERAACGAAGGCSARRLTSFQGQTTNPRLSPDGRWVAYQEWRSGTGWDVTALERATGRVVRVTNDPANEQEPSWLPDGRGLLFASDRARGLGYPALYRIEFAP